MAGSFDFKTATPITGTLSTSNFFFGAYDQTTSVPYIAPIGALPAQTNTFSISGNTVGTSTVSGAGGIVLVGGANVTLSGDGTHKITISAAAGGGGGTTAISGNTAGTTTITTGPVFVGGNNITLSGDGTSNITISGPNTSAQSVQAISVGLSSNSAGSTVSGAGSFVLAGGNNITVSGDGTHNITISGPNTVAQSAENLSGAIVGNTVGTSTVTGSTYILSGGANITLSGNAGSIGIAGVAAQSAVAQTVAISGNTAGTSTATAAGNVITLVGGNNITLSGNSGTPGAITISGPNTAAQSVQAISVGLSSNSAGSTVSGAGSFVLAGGNNITVSGDGTHNITISGPNTVAQSVQAITVGISSNTLGTSTATGAGSFVLVGVGGVTLSGNSGTPGNVTISAATQTVQAITAVMSGNTAGTSTATGAAALTLVGGNNITLSGNSNSAGNVTISGPNDVMSLSGNSAGTSTVSGAMGVIWVGGSNISLSGDPSVSKITINAPNFATVANQITMDISGNTVGTSSFATGAVVLVGGNNITLSGDGTSKITISQMDPFVSSFQNIPLIGASTSASLGSAAGSISHAVSFFLPQPGSFSFLRFPVSMTTGSTTLATTAASFSGSVQVTSTWNAVIYSFGTGANSRSLQYVASASASWVAQNYLSAVAAGNTYTITNNLTYYLEGNSSSTQQTSAFSATNYSFNSTLQTLFSGQRYMDLAFPSSLSAGPYWLVFGYSSNSATQSAGVAAASAAIPKYSYHLVASQFNFAPGIMGSASSIPLGAGSFSTAGGGTTASIPFANITSSASNNMPMFQLIRSA